MNRYQNKYRVASARAQWWDYGWNGAYFITICTKNREHFFGEIQRGKMILSPAGVIADILWYEITNHAPFVELGDYVVMPNHIHGILILDKPGGAGRVFDATGRVFDVGTGVVVGTGHALSLQQPLSALQQKPLSPQPRQQSSPQKQQPPPQPKPPQQPLAPPSRGQTPINPGQNRFQNIGKNTVSSIIGSYKSAVTKHANRLGFENGWQSRFHDHIIRDDAEYQRISDYIIDNPSNWKDDKFYSA